MVLLGTWVHTSPCLPYVVQILFLFLTVLTGSILGSDKDDRVVRKAVFRRNKWLVKPLRNKTLDHIIKFTSQSWLLFSSFSLSVSNVTFTYDMLGVLKLKLNIVWYKEIKIAVEGNIDPSQPKKCHFTTRLTG